MHQSPCTSDGCLTKRSKSTALHGTACTHLRCMRHQGCRRGARGHTEGNCRGGKGAARLRRTERRVQLYSVTVHAARQACVTLTGEMEVQLVFQGRCAWLCVVKSDNDVCTLCVAEVVATCRGCSHGDCDAQLVNHGVCHVLGRCLARCIRPRLGLFFVGSREVSPTPSPCPAAPISVANKSATRPPSWEHRKLADVELLTPGVYCITEVQAMRQ